MTENGKAILAILVGGVILGGASALIYRALQEESHARPPDEFIAPAQRARGERRHRKQVRRQIASRMERSYP